MVTLPHTWNVEDNKEVQLYRGKSQYSTEINIDSLENKKAVIYFGCAFHTAYIYINGIPQVLIKVQDILRLNLILQSS